MSKKNKARKNQVFRQCELKKKRGRGYSVIVRWIPEKYAQKDNTLDIKVDGKWQKGWKVTELYNRAPVWRLTEAERDHEKWRKVTDR
jgi:hypothetical protein